MLVRRKNAQLEHGEVTLHPKHKRQQTESEYMRAIFDYSVISHLTGKDKIWGLAKAMIANKDWDALAKMNQYCARHIKGFRISMDAYSWTTGFSFPSR